MGIAEHHQFKLHMGATLKSLDDLKEALKTMDNTSFHHHVSANKNDFANWVEHIFKDKELSDKLRSAHSKQKMYDILDENLPKEQFEKIDNELSGIKQKMEDLLWKEFSLEKKEDEVTKKEDKIEMDVKKGFGFRNLLYLILGLSIGIIVMVLLTLLGVI